jgi:hypothetical protein
MTCEPLYDWPNKVIRKIREKEARKGREKSETKERKKE